MAAIKQYLLDLSELDKNSLGRLREVIFEELDRITAEPEGGCPPLSGYHCGKWEEGFWYAGW